MKDTFIQNDFEQELTKLLLKHGVWITAKQDKVLIFFMEKEDFNNVMRLNKKSELVY